MQIFILVNCSRVSDGIFTLAFMNKMEFISLRTVQNDVLANLGKVHWFKAFGKKYCLRQTSYGVKLNIWDPVSGTHKKHDQTLKHTPIHVGYKV